MNATLQKPKFNFQLEALRGFAAIAVVIYHITNQKNLFDASYYSPTFEAFAPPGHLCVLVFFMLSGYVIGISNTNKLNFSDIIPYIKKRLVRIYPIYFVCIVFSFLIAFHSYAFTTIIGNLLFAQGLLTTGIIENSPAWSLNYEVVYYAMFIPLSFFKVNPVVLIISLITLGVINFYLYPSVNAPILSAYFWGFSFWLVGLCVAWFMRNRELLQIRTSLLISNLFLLLTISKYDMQSHLLKFVLAHFFKANLIFPADVSFAKTAITFVDLSNIPYCLISVLLFSNTNFKFRKATLVLLQVLPFLSLLYLIPYFKNHDHIDMIAPGIYYAISCLLFIAKSEVIDKFCGIFIKALVWLGGISYGIYIIHCPLLIVIGRINLHMSLVLTYYLRMVLLLIAVIVAAYLLDKVFQPWIKNILVKKPIKKTVDLTS